LSGIGVDTWGVDCAFVGVDGKLVDRPRHYRDPRNAAAMQQVFEIVPRDEVFGYTGVQFMQINTLYQVYAAKIFGEGVLERTGACCRFQTCSISGSPARPARKSRSPAPRSSSTRKP
jgi:sugar (pentulose or hexulose) kinase